MLLGIDPRFNDSKIMKTNCVHPTKRLVSAAEMQARIDSGSGGATRKYDGELSEFKINANGITATLLTEFMRTKISGHFYTADDLEMFRRNPGGWHAALTVSEYRGGNLLNYSSRVRCDLLRDIVGYDYPTGNLVLAETVTDVAETMASGAEGVMWCDWSSPWGNFICHKVLNQWRCRVTATGSTQSVQIADAVTGAAMGSLKLSGGRCDRVRVGSVVKVEGLGLTEKGFIREPRVCRDSPDSWLISY